LQYEYGVEWERSAGSIKLTNEEVLRRVNEESNTELNFVKGDNDGLHVLKHDVLLYKNTEGRMTGKPTRGERIQMLHDLANDA